MRKSNLEKLREAKRQKMAPIEMDFNGLVKLLVDGDRAPEKRQVLPTQAAFIAESERIAGYMGPAGCAKTSTICAIGMLRSILEPGSKGLVSRYDYNDLMDTTKLRLTDMLARLPHGTLLDRDKSPPEKWYLKPVGDGEPSQITFMGLKESLGSYEFNWAIIDEADEVEEKRVHEVNSRLRHIRKGKDAAGNDLETTYALRLSMNPPDKHHWFYTACTGRDFQDRVIPGKEPWVKLYRPKSNENEANLPPDYYDRLSASLPEDMKQRLVDGEWGSTFEGQAVFREFKFAVHVKDSLAYDPGATLFRFWDFGYNRPACIWAQFDWQGRLMFLRETLGEREEATAFARRVKSLTKQHFPRAHRFMDYGDPAVVQHKDTGRTLNELVKEGITIHYQKSEIETGLRLIRQRLSLLIDGEPALQYDRRGCPILIAAMRGGYRLDDQGKKAKKDGYYDHLADAMRYGVLNLLGGGGTSVSHAVSEVLPGSVEYDPALDVG